MCKIFLDTGPDFCLKWALGNSEQWKMTGRVDNVGVLATESGVEQFQLSLRGILCPSGPSILAAELHRAPFSTTHNPADTTGEGRPAAAL